MRLLTRLLPFARDRRGVAALETAMLLMPFVGLLLPIIDTGVYFMSQSSLDSGVLTTTNAVRSSLLLTSSYTAPSAATLKTQIAANAGAVINVANLSVDVRQLSTLAAGAVPIADGTTDWGSGGSIVVVRAQAPVNWFFPGVTVMTISSMAIIRRPST